MDWIALNNFIWGEGNWIWCDLDGCFHEGWDGKLKGCYHHKDLHKKEE